MSTVIWRVVIHAKVLINKYVTDSLEEPLSSDSQRTDPLTSVGDNTPSLHSHDTIGKAEQSKKPSAAEAEQSKKPSPAGSQTTTEQSFSQFHASSTAVTGLFLYTTRNHEHNFIGMSGNLLPRGCASKATMLFCRLKFLANCGVILKFFFP